VAPALLTVLAFSRRRLRHRQECLCHIILDAAVDNVLTKTVRSGLTLHCNSIFQPELDNDEVVLDRDRRAIETGWLIHPFPNHRYDSSCQQWMAGNDHWVRHVSLFRDERLYHNLALYARLARQFWVFRFNVVQQFELDGRAPRSAGRRRAGFLGALIAALFIVGISGRQCRRAGG